jgi:hypothetical protein
VSSIIKFSFEVLCFHCDKHLIFIVVMYIFIKSVFRCLHTLNICCFILCLKVIGVEEGMFMRLLAAASAVIMAVCSLFWKKSTCFSIQNPDKVEIESLK